MSTNLLTSLITFNRIHAVCESERREPTDDEQLTLRDFVTDVTNAVRTAFELDDDTILDIEVVYGPNYAVRGVTVMKTLDEAGYFREAVFTISC